MENEKEQIILDKLGLGKRSALFILANEKLCDRILNETPIWLLDYMEKYDVGLSFITRLINDNIISSFLNGKVKRGRKVFIFEEEATRIIGENSSNMSFHTIIEQKLNIFFSIADKSLSELESDIFRKVLFNRGSRESIGNEHGMTRERVGQIYYKGYRKINSYLSHLTEYDKILEAIGPLRKEHLILTRAVSGIKEEHKIKNSDVMCINIRDLDCSVRLFNCLKYADFETLYDISIIERKQLLRYRNFGKKTINELDDIMEKHGLTYGN